MIVFFPPSLWVNVNAYNIFIVVLRPGDALVMEFKGGLGLCVEIPSLSGVAVEPGSWEDRRQHVHPGHR